MKEAKRKRSYESLPKGVSRRGFLEMIIKGGLFATLAGMIMPALAYLWPVTKKGPTIRIKEVGRLDDIPVWGAKKVIVEGSAILIVRKPNEIKAISSICTHLGCIVDWDDKSRQIVCPCHAGFFDVDGRVVSGPPPKDLPTYQVRIEEDKIFVMV